MVWTESFAAPGLPVVVREVAAQDPRCFAATCGPGSYSHWYLDHAHPYFGGEEPLPVPDFDLRHQDPAVRCGAEGSVSFHWRAPSMPNRLAETSRCPHDRNPTWARSAQWSLTPARRPTSTQTPSPTPPPRPGP